VAFLDRAIDNSNSRTDGLLFSANFGSDMGVLSFNINNVVLSPSYTFIGLQGTINVIRWNNVRDTNDNPIPSPG
jgi:hypothetical protein